MKVIPQARKGDVVDDYHGTKKETEGTALPIVREIMLRVYKDQLVGPVPQFPREIENGIHEYLAMQVALEDGP
jgi:hypothetical protein